MVTLLKFVPQALLIVHVKVYEVLAANPVTFVLGSLTLSKTTPADGVTDHIPVSFKEAGLFPFNIYGAPAQIVSFAPALAVVGVKLDTTTLTSFC
jgi:hypothetical protein